MHRSRPSTCKSGGDSDMSVFKAQDMKLPSFHGLRLRLFTSKFGALRRINYQILRVRYLEENGGVSLIVWMSAQVVVVGTAAPILASLSRRRYFAMASWLLACAICLGLTRIQALKRSKSCFGCFNYVLISKLSLTCMYEQKLGRVGQMQTSILQGQIQPTMPWILQLRELSVTACSG